MRDDVVPLQNGDERMLDDVRDVVAEIWRK